MTDLTPRQTQVLALVATGCTNAEIAARLGISANTVGEHLARIARKIGFADGANRTLIAVRYVEVGTVGGTPVYDVCRHHLAAFMDGGCLVFASQHSALVALAGMEAGADGR